LENFVVLLFGTARTKSFGDPFWFLLVNVVVVVETTLSKKATRSKQQN
jgi:hypothetical protein